MDNKEILDALHETRTQLYKAHEIVDQATSKLLAVTSQLQENLRITGQTLVPLAPSTLGTSDAPGSEDLTEQALREGVPYSAASALHKPTPEAAVLKQPTSVAARPTVQASRPTVAPEELQRTMEERKREQLGHFFGIGSLFARALSPEVIIAGKGMLKPKVAGLEQYNEDAQVLPLAALAEWPTGFYRDHQTSAVQFLINLQSAIVFIPSLADTLVRQPLVARKPFAPQQRWQVLGELELLDILMIKEQVETELKRLSDTVVVPMGT